MRSVVLTDSCSSLQGVIFLIVRPNKLQAFRQGLVIKCEATCVCCEISRESNTFFRLWLRLWFWIWSRIRINITTFCYTTICCCDRIIIKKDILAIFIYSLWSLRIHGNKIQLCCFSQFKFISKCSPIIYQISSIFLIHVGADLAILNCNITQLNTSSICCSCLCKSFYSISTWFQRDFLISDTLIRLCITFNQNRKRTAMSNLRLS